MIHQRHIQKTLDKLKRLERVYELYIFKKVDEIPVVYWETQEHRYRVPGEEEDWNPVCEGMAWGKAWGSAWFKGEYRVPSVQEGQKIYIRANTDGVETLFWVDGKPSGIFTHSKEADNRGNHHTLLGIIGHSHMDTAWLWTRDETIRKCARTYANALALMEQYPEYTFIQSSAFHAELMRRHYPDIFESMKKRIAEGRWEPNGGVWIECDCNLVSGESLVRQFLKGQRYTRKHFGYTADAFWLPDTFGYSAAIPQIMVGAGVKYFLTTKLSWNDTNAFPYDTFRWRGLDGTEVLTHFNFIHCWPDAGSLIERVYGTAYGSNGVSVQSEGQPRLVNDKRLVSYGYGDGGGGPQYEMLETARRVFDLEGAPKTAHTTVSRFMRGLEKASAKFPVHVGELYFEGHRGTLTQMHQIKRNNRKAELAIRDLEFAEVWVRRYSGVWNEEATEQRERIHATLLINQFHDILPGTSIPEVHDRALLEITEVVSHANRWTKKLLGDIDEEDVDGDSMSVTLWNTLAWDRQETFALEGDWGGACRGKSRACQPTNRRYSRQIQGADRRFVDTGYEQKDVPLEERQALLREVRFHSCRK